MKSFYIIGLVVSILTACGKGGDTPAPTPSLPSLTTTPVNNITSTSASAGGNISADGGATVTARGVCWNISASPTIANSRTTDGTGTGIFTSALSGLTAVR